MMYPPSKNRTLSEISLANPISCVTTIIVMPLSARVLMRLRTSPTISGSSADVGSSKSMTSGFMARALMMAIRCCCPPESLEGCWSALSVRPILFRRSSAFAEASSSVIRPSLTGASMMFSFTVIWGKRLKLWNTIPIL